MDDVQVEEKLKGINLLSVFSMVLNVMVGAGVFGMPLAYEGAGLVLSLVVLTVFFILAVITALYLLEGIARVSTYLKRLKILGGDVDCNVEIYETYGYTSIASAIGGKAFKITINVLIVINLLTVLWAFVGTSVGTLSSVYWSFYDDYDRCDVVGHFHKGWECQVTYYGTMAVFAIVAVPLSYIKLGSQSIVHILLMIYAIACFTLLIGTCILEIIENGLSYEVKYFEIKGFGTVFSHSALALVCNLSVPDIIRPARNKKKVQYPIIVAVSVATMFYGCVGSVGSITFGDEIKSPVTLNWGNYTGIDGGWGSGETLWFAYIVRYFIMFFPIVNVLSSFPIVAASTSSNVESMFSPKIKMNHERIIHYSSLTFCIIVPFCLASISSSLELIFDVSGSFCFLLAFIIPCIFHIFSIPLLQKIHWFKPKPKTPYTWYHSIPVLSVVLCLISICAFILSIVFIIVGLIKDEDTTTNSSASIN